MKDFETRKCIVCGKEIYRRYWHKNTASTCGKSCSGKLASLNAKTFYERLWERIDKRGPNDCWEWMGYKKNGYGVIYKGDQAIYAHRAIYEFENGEIGEGLEACHKCDNKACCNPFHIFIGTHTDNMKDMIGKGRDRHPSMVGKSHGKQVIFQDDAEKIKHLYFALGHKQTEISKIYGVHLSTIKRIIHK